MASTDQLPELLERLTINKYDPKDCIAAIKGERIPGALGLSLVRLCVVRGIRYNDGFARDLRGVSPVFTRALNARDIMSDRIPIIASDEETPYCIWHPQVASEATYRQLAKRYPSMSYQVGRACAVAGYIDLYKELGILPDVHIAEEARECGHSAIFDHIMTQRIRYEVMNDYSRTINTNNPAAAHLNGDTAVCSSLDIKQRFSEAEDPDAELEDMDPFGGPGYFDNDFDITEDMSIDVHDCRPERDPKRDYTAHNDLLIKLLTEPLPTELPTMNKSLLIHMAAYYGDIERYVRLRRPKMIDGELECCVRGIHHNTMFAVWWSKQKLPAGRSEWKLGQAICARFIMNNVLSRVTKSTCDMPYLIWYPTIAAQSTYRKLAQMSPGMIPQVLRACMVANYVDLFDELLADVIPDKAVVEASRESANQHFKEVVAARVKAVGFTEMGADEFWKLRPSNQLDRCSCDILKNISLDGPSWGWWELRYDGMSCTASHLDLMACLPKEWRIPKDCDDEPEFPVLDYVDWPRQRDEPRGIGLW